jgi:hypothetical protein
MDIALLYFDGCPNWKVADRRIRRDRRRRTGITVTRCQVDTIDEAERVGFYGSPSILLDGVDVFADEDAGWRAVCTPPQPASGACTLEQLRAAITDA